MTLHRKCSKCGLTGIEDRSVPYFCFPLPGKNNIVKARAWAIYCWPEKDWTSVEELYSLHKKRKFLCGRHFRDTCFLDSSKRKIGKFACPGTAEYVNDMLNKLRAGRNDVTQTMQKMLEDKIIWKSKKHATPQPLLSECKNLSSPKHLLIVYYVDGKSCDDPNDVVHSDHTYVKDGKETSYIQSVQGTTGIQSVGEASTSKIDLLPTSRSGTDKNETSTLTGTEEPAAEDEAIEFNDFTPTSPDPPPDLSSKDENVFSWQKSELIPADEDEPQPAEVVPTLDLEGPTDPSGISLYDDSEPVSNATAPPGPAEIEYVCKACGERIDGFQFWCVQCVGCVLCGACEALGVHNRHYMLRVPAGKLHSQTQAVLGIIRQQLQNENLLKIIEAEDDGVKVEVKEEPPEEAVVLPPAPAEPDPLACSRPASAAPSEALSESESCPLPLAQSITDHDPPVHDATVDDPPFKRPRLENYHTVQKSTIARPVATKLIPITTKITPAGTKIIPVNRLLPVATTVAPLSTKITPVPTRHISVAAKITPVVTRVTPIATTVAPLTTKVVPLQAGQSRLVLKVTPTIIPISTKTRPNILSKVKPVSTKVTPTEPSRPIEIDDSDNEVEYTEIEALDDDMEERIEEEHIERVEEIIEEDIERLESDIERESEVERLESDVERIEDVEPNYDSDSEISEYIPEKRKDRRVVRSDDDSTDDSDLENIATRGLSNIATRGLSKRIESITKESKISEGISNVRENVARSMDVRKVNQTEETLKLRGPEEVMSQIFPTKALVRVRPLSSLEVLKWTDASKKD